MKNNISKLRNCYGCGVCTAACPVSIISLRLNEKGFYEPAIDCEEKCIECGMCLKVCAFNNAGVTKSSEAPEAFAGWSRRPVVRQRCSSGGVGFELGAQLIADGMTACGVKYDIAKKRAEHYLADTVDDFAQSIGSKYIQSFSMDAFRMIDRKKKYFVTGTPCQIDSFRRYIRHFRVEDNFLLMDFFCHGVPSYLLWNKYIGEVEKITGQPQFVSWRNKTDGWQDSWSINVDPIDSSSTSDWHNSYNINVLGKKHFYHSRWKGGDLFYRFFLGNYCLNECCYKSCKYKKLNSAADIRIGDLWGKTFENDQKGVNGVVAFTEKGKAALQELTDCQLSSCMTSTVMEGQMSKSPVKPIIYNRLMAELSGRKSLGEIYGSLIKVYRLYTLPKRAVNMICYKLHLKPIFH